MGRQVAAAAVSLAGQYLHDYADSKLVIGCNLTDFVA